MARGVGKEGATPLMRAAYEMRKNGSTWNEVGRALNLTTSSVREHVAGAERHGLPVLPKRDYQRRAVITDPEAVRNLVGGLGLVAEVSGEFDLKRFLDVAAAAGIPPRLATALGRRVAANYGPVREALKKMNLAERVEDITARADLIASHIDEVSIAGMNAKDLGIAWKVLIDGAQLLGGKPTQIFDFNVRRRLEVLMPEFLAEAKRRGITLEGEFKAVVQESEAA